MKFWLALVGAVCLAGQSIAATPFDAEIAAQEAELTAQEALQIAEEALQSAQEVQLAAAEAEHEDEDARLAVREEELEARLDEARAQLDKAARQLAEASKEAYAYEYKTRSDRPVLGVLLLDGGNESGMTLSGVTPDGGAVDAGLKAGDKIVALNGVKLDGPGEKPLKRWNKALEGVAPGDTVEVTFKRDGSSQTASVVTQQRRDHVVKMLDGLDGIKIELAELGEEIGKEISNMPELKELANLSSLSALSALENMPSMSFAFSGEHDTRLVDVDESLGDYFGVDGGVLVLHADEESELRSGDILLEVAGQEIAKVSDAYLAFGKAEAADGKIEAKVRRKKRERDVAIAESEFPRAMAFGDHAKRVIRLERRQGADDADVQIIIDTDE